MLENKIKTINSCGPSSWGALFLLVLVMLTMTGVTEHMFGHLEGSAIELTIDLEKDAEKENKKNKHDAEVDDYFHASGLFNLSVEALSVPNFGKYYPGTNSYLEAPKPPPELS